VTVPDVYDVDEPLPAAEEFVRELAGEMAANTPPKTREGWTPGVEMGAVDGQAVSEPIESDDPNLTLDEAELIRRWHLDPETWEIIPGTLLVNRWQGMTARQTGNRLVWLYQYKARLRRNITDDTLPMGLRKGADWRVTVKARSRRKPGDLPDSTWEAGVFYPDPQIGYWFDEAGVIHTIHDERCFDIRNQILLDLRAEYGRIAKVVGAGDTGDFSHWSSFQTVPAYLERTLQPALDRITLEWAQLRAICPDDDELIWILDGNHDGQRLLKTLLAKGLQSLVGVRQGGVDIADHPVLSIQHLTRTDDYGIRYVEPFPSATVEFNESLGCAHGPAYSSAKLGTATKVLAQARRSMLHGHTHREESIAVTLWTDKGPRTYYVGSPGTFSRTDLAVPSVKSKPTSRGVPAVGQGTEDWQQGFYVVLYDTEAPHHFQIEQVRIWNAVGEEPSVAYWRGRRYVSSCDADGNPVGP
jgi:hypothetical protein